MGWWTRFGLSTENLRLRQHTKEELSHYAKDTYDIEYRFPFAGFSELEGIANRTDYDLRQHAKHSGRELNYFDDELGHIVPYVIEPAAGVDRAFLAFLCEAYTEENVPTGSGGAEVRTVLKFHPALAPIKVAVLPLSRNERLAPAAQEVYASLRPHFMTQFDDAQSIGRRYRRQDEIGTPLCVTIDFETLEDRAVTIRDRDDMTQVRVPIAELIPAIRERVG
jgi:glycyl-tRNA synthetase